MFAKKFTQPSVERPHNEEEMEYEHFGGSMIRSNYTECCLGANWKQLTRVIFKLSRRVIELESCYFDESQSSQGLVIERNLPYYVGRLVKVLCSYQFEFDNSKVCLHSSYRLPTRLEQPQVNQATGVKSILSFHESAIKAHASQLSPTMSSMVYCPH